VLLDEDKGDVNEPLLVGQVQDQDKETAGTARRVGNLIEE